MKDFPYTQSFGFTIKPLVSEEKDKYLSTASLEQVRKFLPEIDTKANGDILPIAFNACVIGRVNKNADVLDKDTALAIYKNFLYKQINIEHKRSNVVGCILTAGFSEFGTDKPLTEEEVKVLTGPFNITLGGIIWRVVNGGLADFVEDSNDPTSPNYMAISASWELGFSDYKIVLLPEGQKNIENGEIIASSEEIEKYKPKLKALGGTGVTEDGKYIYRMPSQDVTPLGIGLTEKPAADVEGVATKNEEVKASIGISEDKLNISENKISQSKKEDVIKVYNIMEINSLKDITDENLKEVKASVITDFISNTLSTKSKEWEAEQNRLTSELSKASEDYKKISDEYSKLQESLKQIQATVDALNKEKKEREEVEKFNIRMASVAELFELDDDAKAAIVEEVKSLASDEAYDKWLTKAKVLLKGFAKKKEVKKEMEEEKMEECETCGKAHKGACAKESKASVETTVTEALDKSKQEKGGLPNTSTTQDKTFVEKYKHAFGTDSFIVRK